MQSLYQLIALVEEFYIGLKVGFRHNYWICCYLCRKIWKNVLNLVSNNNEIDHNLNNSSDLHDDGRAMYGNGVSGFKVVGVGFGRTGTYSLGLALNELGFPTLHTYHLYENSQIIDMWTEKVFRPAIETKTVSLGNPDFGIILSGGFVSAVDFPLALYFEQLNELYPDCKFILTVRQNSDIWFQSWSTLVSHSAEPTKWGAGILNHVNQLSLYLRWLFAYIDKDESILSIPPGKTIPKPNRYRSISSYEEHNQRVRETIPSDRLLEYDVQQGWDPLCKFLEVDECPSRPFPKTNSAFSLKVQTISSLLIPLIIFLFIISTAFTFGFKRCTGKKVRPCLFHQWNSWRRLMKKLSIHKASRWSNKLQKAR